MKKKKLINTEEEKSITEEEKIKNKKKINILKKKKRKMRKKLKKIHLKNTKNNSIIEKTRQELFKKYKQITNKLNDIRKKNKIKKLLNQAERIDKLTKDYDGISWKKIKELIPKVSNFQNIIEEAINEEGEVVKGAQFLEVWRKAYLKLGKENTLEDEKDFNTEFKIQLEKELQNIIIIEKGIKEKLKKEKKNKKEEETTLLNNKISFQEVETAIKEMKLGVAHGTDGIVNEVIKKGSKNIIRLVWKLIDNCFTNEVAPDQWLTGIQHPLYKSGEKRDPLNYRGIMLLNVTSKLYEAILEKRLDT